MAKDRIAVQASLLLTGWVFLAGPGCLAPEVSENPGALNPGWASDAHVSQALEHCSSAQVLSTAASRTGLITDLPGTFAGRSSHVITSCGGTNANLADVWYSYTVPTRGKTYVKFKTSGSASDTILAIYEGACGSLISLACADAATGADELRMSLHGGANGPKTYYVVVKQDQATADAYNLRVTSYTNEAHDTGLWWVGIGNANTPSSFATPDGVYTYRWSPHSLAVDDRTPPPGCTGGSTVTSSVDGMLRIGIPPVTTKTISAKLRDLSGTADPVVYFEEISGSTVPQTCVDNSGPGEAFASATFVNAASGVKNYGLVLDAKASAPLKDHEVIITVGNDTQAPTVAISSPADGSSVNGIFTVNAVADDNIGVMGVQLKIDGVNAGGEDLSTPFSFSLDTATISNGTHQLTATARDAAGNLSISAAVTFVVAIGPPTTVIAYSEIAGDILNPERGWYKGINLAAGASVSNVRGSNMTLGLALLDLGELFAAEGANAATDDTVPAALITKLNAGMNRVRELGYKLIIRTKYFDDDVLNDDGTPSMIDDPPVSRVQTHLRQLHAQVFNPHSDVVMVYTAGYVGKWGEFHSSAMFTSANLWKQVLDSVFSTAAPMVLPTDRMLQMRTPMLKEQYFNRGKLTDAEGFTQSTVARTGHFNDCFLSSDTDTGTYPSAQIELYKDFVAQDTRYTPHGGETCPVKCNGVNCPSARANCSVAVPEMARLHTTYLNSGWFQGITDPVTGVFATQGCRDEITERLGYRFVLEQATLTPAVRPGHLLGLTVRLRNEGFANPFEARSVHAVLKLNQAPFTTYTVELTGADVDARRWASGQTRTFSRKLTVPSTTPAGTYTLSLWLPDARTSIRSRPEYAIRLANEGTWDTATGYNRLTTNISVSASAAPNPGTGDGTFQ